jgi:hypothetical protein
MESSPRRASSPSNSSVVTQRIQPCPPIHIAALSAKTPSTSCRPSPMTPLPSARCAAVNCARSSPPLASRSPGRASTAMTREPSPLSQPPRPRRLSLRRRRHPTRHRHPRLRPRLLRKNRRRTRSPLRHRQRRHLPLVHSTPLFAPHPSPFAARQLHRVSRRKRWRMLRRPSVNYSRRSGTCSPIATPRRPRDSSRLRQRAPVRRLVGLQTIVVLRSRRARRLGDRIRV